MEAADVLPAVAEIALGLAGFTGIVVAIGRAPGPIRPLEAYRLAMLLSVSAGAMFLALLPLALGGAPWRAASLVAAACTGLLLALFWRPTRRWRREVPWLFHRWLFLTLVSAHAANLLAQLGNAAGVWGRAAAPRIYLAGLMWMLAHAFIQFCRLLFIPTERHAVRPAEGRAGGGEAGE